MCVLKLWAGIPNLEALRGREQVGGQNLPPSSARVNNIYNNIGLISLSVNYNLSRRSSFNTIINLLLSRFRCLSLIFYLFICIPVPVQGTSLDIKKTTNKQVFTGSFSMHKCMTPMYAIFIHLALISVGSSLMRRVSNSGFLKAADSEYPFAVLITARSGR